MIAKKPSLLVSYAAGDIATQALLSLLVNLYIGGCDDHDTARTEITNAAVDMIDRASVPDRRGAE